MTFTPVRNRDLCERAWRLNYPMDPVYRSQFAIRYSNEFTDKDAMLP
jgi:hypothetical protein